MRVRVELLAKAKWRALMAARVVFPTCRPQQAAISGDSSCRNFSW